MTITRIINGELITIELESIELQRAANEYDYICHVDDIKEHLHCNDIEMTPEQIDDAATRIDNILECYDNYWNCYWDAVDAAIEEVKSEEEEEEDETDEM